MLPAAPSLINGFFSQRFSIVGSGGAIVQLGTSDPTRIYLAFSMTASFTYAPNPQNLPGNGFFQDTNLPPVEYKYADVGNAVCLPWYGVGIGSFQVFEVFYRPYIQKGVK